VSEWRVLLLGGTTASGKSTTARKLADHLSIGCISADSVWRSLLAITTPETHPVLHRWPRADEDPGEAKDLAELHIEEARLMAPALEAFLRKEVQEGNWFIFHGAWLTPNLAAAFIRSNPAARAVFLDETTEDELLAAIVTRSGRAEANRRQRVMAEVAVIYGAWLRDGAEGLGLPLVAARPRDTLVERILEAAERPLPASTEREARI
jgi:2-phosphoglycerate kinase